MYYRYIIFIIQVCTLVRLIFRQDWRRLVYIKIVVKVLLLRGAWWPSSIAGGQIAHLVKHLNVKFSGLSIFIWYFACYIFLEYSFPSPLLDQCFPTFYGFSNFLGLCHKAFRFVLLHPHNPLKFRFVPLHVLVCIFATAITLHILMIVVSHIYECKILI